MRRRCLVKSLVGDLVRSFVEHRVFVYVDGEAELSSSRPALPWI